jgi:molybdopterin-guanine dinucleotide biosynthesis protein MobB
MVLRLIGISGSTKSIRSSLTEEVMKEIMKGGDKVAIAICAKSRDLGAFEKDAHHYLDLGAEAVMKITPSNILVLAKSRPILDALELVPPIDYLLAEGCEDTPIPRITIGEKKPHALGSWSLGDSLDDVLSKVKSLPSIRVRLTLDGKGMALKPYVQDVIIAIIEGFLSTLKGYEKNAKKVSLRMDLRKE